MKKLLLSILCIAIIITAGCWDQHEINEVSIVTGMAIDTGTDDKYKLTVELLNPTGLDPNLAGEEAASIIFVLEGDSIAELQDKMNVGFTRKLIYSHLRTLIFSTDIGREELLNFFDFLERDREIRNDFNLLIVDNAEAGDVLKITYPIQRASSLKLHTQLETMIHEWGGQPDIRLKDFISALVSPGREPIAVMVKVEGSPQIGKTFENRQLVDPKAWVVIDGLSIFKGTQYQGVLPIKHTRNYLLLDNKLSNTTLTVPCNEQLNSTLRVHDTTTQIKAFYHNGQPHVQVYIEIEGRINQSECGGDFSKIETYLDYEKKFANAIKEELATTISILQEDYKADIFGFGEQMERQDYRNFKKVKEHWNEEFARAVIDVNVNVRVRRAGLTTKSFLPNIIEE